MTCLNLLKPQGLASLERFATPHCLFAFDLDGTLAPIKVHAWEVTLAPGLRTALKRLAELAKVCVLTGRSREAALSILTLELHLVIGNHGCEWPPEIRPRNPRFIETCRIWRDWLEARFLGEEGVEIEYKGETLAIHFRKAAQPLAALSRIEEAVQQLEPAPRVIGGKFVMNLLPRDAQTKGTALLEAMQLVGATRALYFGDDVTDEEVFKLGSAQLLGVHVGREETAAPYYLDAQSEVETVVKRAVQLLERQLPGS
jgi:trehalose 6-phosphate phosphatase